MKYKRELDMKMILRDDITTQAIIKWLHPLMQYRQLSTYSHWPEWRVKSRASNEGSPNVPEDFTITEKTFTRAFSWLKKLASAFTIKTLLRHYPKQAFSVIEKSLQTFGLPSFEALVKSCLMHGHDAGFKYCEARVKCAATTQTSTSYLSTYLVQVNTCNLEYWTNAIKTLGGGGGVGRWRW